MENLFSDWQGFLYASFFQLLLRIPIIAVYIFGIVIAFSKSEKYPKISFLSGLGFGILLILSVLSVLISILPPYFHGKNYDAQSIGFILSIIGFIISLISAGAAAMLIRATWKDRA